MSNGIKRREFLSGALAGAGWFVLTACASPVPGRGQRDLPLPTAYAFPQGIASADPRPGSIVLWTRVEPRQRGEDRVAVRVEVSRDPNFEELVVDREVEATLANDHTIRAVVEKLDSDTHYYYRFAVGDGGSPTGRTRTAPAENADREVRFAFVSCQNYENGYFSGYRRMLHDDDRTDEDERIDFVLHLGDFIYEVIGIGGPREILAFPGGPKGKWRGLAYATTLEDYRYLYKVYLSDPDLQAARARWPFVCTWDDHEFSNDCWQSRATYDSPDTPAQTRKLAANQAWFEFVPARLDGTVGVRSVLQRAHDFRPTTVVDAPFTGVDPSGLDRERNNIEAISSLTIYRSLRFGKHVDLVVTDTRSYRSDHALPEEVAIEQFGSTKMLPVRVVEICDAGRSYAEGRAPKTIDGPKGEFVNPRRLSPAGTILGGRQNRWFKQTVSESTATWKLWANSVPLLPIRFDLQNLSADREEVMLSPDTWDGYMHERAELLRYLDTHVPNFVSFTGDNHMHFAGQVMLDFDTTTLTPIGTEFACCGISSSSMYRLFRFVGGEQFGPFVSFDSRPFGGDDPDVELFNMTMLDGMVAAATVAKTGDVAQGRAARNPDHARHLRYIDSNGHGYGLAHVRADRVVVRLISIVPPDEPGSEAGAEVLRTVRFEVPARKPGEPSTFEGPFFDSGKPPFPFAS